MTFFAQISLLVRRILDALPRPRAASSYRPEQHYMRGPGPKTRQAMTRRTKAIQARDQADRQASHPADSVAATNGAHGSRNA